MSLSENTWDFFISFATPDSARAEEQRDLLERQGWKVFFAAGSIGPGEIWDEKLSKALKGSRVVAVLLSEHSAGAHYQREEIHLAIGLERDSKLKLVPVYLEGVPREPADWELGLRSYQRLDFRQEGATKTAEAVPAPPKTCCARPPEPTRSSWC